ncbi:MAG: thioredoxin [Gracilimonas sp.]|uniref:thioredoxin n=1 Tax=Gracilimonas sp. TaxID=1974203 RepID=UPI0019A9D25F|nr:thioredoxin [Gracilimonas sp.]MBD3615034.1 thioredoxin [Gracilimonas sp.]
MENTETKQKSFSEIINDEVPVLVDFYADWCAPCKMMTPILQQLKHEMGDKLNIIKVDTERNPDVAIKYQVRGIPNLILFHKGELLWQQAGVVQMPQLKQIIEQQLEQR